MDHSCNVECTSWAVGKQCKSAISMDFPFAVIALRVARKKSRWVFNRGRS